MTREEIIIRIQEFAKDNGYQTTQHIDKVAEAKRRIGKNWTVCPCHRDGEHYCGSLRCTKDIQTNGVCGCNLFKKVE